MELYNLIIIDDERLSLKYIESFINWHEYGFNISGCFDNARDALIFIDKNKVHAVITDIQMDITDGIEFTKICLRKYPDMAVAIVTAHRNFEYAREAVQLNVLGYLLKPLVKNEMIKLCEKMYSFIQRRELIAASGLENINSDFSEHDIQINCQKIFLDIFYNFVSDIESAKNALVRENILAETGECYSVLLNITLCEHEAYLKNIWKHSEHTLYNAICLLIPFRFDNTFSVPLMYSNGQLLVLLVSQSPGILDSDCTVTQRLSEYLSKMASQNLKLTVSAEPIHRFSSVEEMVGFVNRLPLLKSTETNETINQITEYINKNYASIESLNDVADYIHLNPVYLGRFFKNKMNVTFKSYLNNLKINKSKEFLKDPKLSTSAVAASCGFKNENYFYKTFKAITGKTPQQYRQSFLD